MMHTTTAQFPQNSNLNQVNRRDVHPELATRLRAVVPDIPVTPPAPPATPQPAPSKNNQRPVRTSPNTKPHQPEQSLPARKVRVDLWVEPLVRTELISLAKAHGLNLSQTGNALLKRVLRDSLYEQHEALIEPVIKEAIHKEMVTLLKRLSFLLVRVGYASEQTRGLVTNLLNYQTAMTPEKLTALLNGASKAAKRKILETTPQIKRLMEELEQVFLTDEH